MPTIQDVPTFELPGSAAYAVPAPNSDEENGFLDSPSGAWAAGLHSVPGGTPDPMRLGTMPERDFRPNPTRAPEEFWSDREQNKDDRDKEYNASPYIATGWRENPGSLPMGEGGQARFAPNPRTIVSPEPRPTNRLSPASWSFTRDMWGGPMRNNGEHFSMADFRRDYPIRGTAPVRTWRNTYRVQPVPYDVDMVDVDPTTQTQSVTPAVIESPVPAMAANQWRLS
jgi:hypothetical protein